MEVEARVAEAAAAAAVAANQLQWMLAERAICSNHSGPIFKLNLNREFQANADEQTETN